MQIESARHRAGSVNHFLPGASAQQHGLERGEWKKVLSGFVIELLQTMRAIAAPLAEHVVRVEDSITHHPDRNVEEIFSCAFFFDYA